MPLSGLLENDAKYKDFYRKLQGESPQNQFAAPFSGRGLIHTLLAAPLSGWDLIHTQFAAPFSG